MARKKKEVTVNEVAKEVLEDAVTVSEAPATLQEEVARVAPVVNKPDPFAKLNTDFYSALEELRVEKEEHPDHKVLIANAGAYMTKAMRAIKLIKEL